MTEVWKKLDINHNYEVSNCGRVRSLYDARHKVVRTKILKPVVQRNGYLLVGIAGKRCSVHRLVASAFIPNEKNLPQVNHKDENKANNHVDNLEWCTAKYNTRYSTKGDRLTHLKDHMKKLGQKTGGVYAAKWSKEHNSKPVVGFVAGKQVYLFCSLREAEKQTGIASTSISHCCNGTKQYKSAGKYNGEKIVWKFV